MALTKLSSSEIQTGAITADKISGDVALSMRIANVSIANSTYTVLDDTAVNVGGGYIVVTGAGFQSGAQVIINETPATSTTYVSSTELRAQVGAKSAATYNVYVVNPDGGSAIRVNGITYSGSPTWVTSSTLNSQAVNVAFNITFSATGATSYSNTTALPAGTTLLSNGHFYGTVTGIESETTYNFTISAIDDENQNSDRAFSLTVVPTNMPLSVEYLVVAGGGGGGAWRDSITNGGGGGAGGFRTGNLNISLSQTYTVTVGSGGSGGISGGYMGANGSISSISTIESAGGGAGGSYFLAGSSTQHYNGFPGGSGGGGGGLVPSITPSTNGGLGNIPSVSPSQGNNGGPGGGAVGGGGGGASAASPNSIGGNGSEWPTGSGTYYAGGGNGFGGPGGGTAPLGGAAQQSTAPANSGGGGGGGNGGGGSAGGSGVVIVRYSSTKDDATTTTGSPTYTNTGGYKTYKFTGSGSITW